jgi:hypothetical protein
MNGATNENWDVAAASYHTVTDGQVRYIERAVKINGAGALVWSCPGPRAGEWDETAMLTVLEARQIADALEQPEPWDARELSEEDIARRKRVAQAIRSKCEASRLGYV